jgi:hypothetical protein
METRMKRTALAFGAVLALLGGCAPYATSGAYYGGGYYEPSYYGPDRADVPYGGYGNGYHRDDRDDHRHYRGPDRGDHHDGDRGGRSWSRGDNQPAPQAHGERGDRGNFWQQRSQPAAPHQTAQPGDPGGGRGFGRHRDN